MSDQIPETTESPGRGSSPQPGKRRTGPGTVIIAVIIGIIAVLVIILYFIAALQPGSPGAVIPSEQCGQNAVAYLNANIISGGTGAQLVTVTEKSGVYEIMTRYQGRDIPVYATRDCSILFTSAIPIPAAGTCSGQAGACSPSRTQPAPAPELPVKSARPAVELYVMSFCPYGVQAENVLIPVADLLGNRTDIRVRYIATVEGDSIATAQSLHGNAEAVEDARQLCIMKYAPERYWHYVSAFNAQCYPVWNNAGQLAACRKNVTVAAGISEAVIDNCANGSEGTGLLKEDAKRVEATGTSASPTLLINGQEYSGARTPDAFKQAICSHFDVPPVACNTTLSSQAAAASGGCG